MTGRAPTQRTCFDTACGDLGMAVAAEAMEIAFDGQRELRADLVAEIAGVAARIVKKIMVTGGALDRRMIVMIKHNG